MFLTGSVSVICLVLGFTNGFKTYRSQIPNGDRVPHPCQPNVIWQGVGHKSPAGGNERNPFGLDWKANGFMWNSTICQKDSDGDGFTNGQELGDPQCTWTNGTTPSRTTSITHPGVCTPVGSQKCQGKDDWVNCGGFTCPAVNESATRNITFRFPRTSVPNMETNYMCMTFDLPNDKPYHLIASTPVIDNADVLHHIAVFGCDGTGTPQEFSKPTPCGMAVDMNCISVISGWTVGLPGSCVNPNTGFLFGKGSFSKIIFQIHWNNPKLWDNYTDSSGMTLYYTPNLRPTSAATFIIGQFALEIPPRQLSVSVTGVCSGECSNYLIHNNITAVGLGHHMHYLGRSQVTELFRNGIKVSTLANETNYSYDSPVSYILNPPVVFFPGDEVRTTCTYSSEKINSTTLYGESTSAEMCFAFFIVYPRENLPIGKSCVAWKNDTLCPGLPNSDHSVCSPFNYFHPENQAFANLSASLNSSCNSLGPCTPSCKQLVDHARQTNPCWTGPGYEITKQLFKGSFDGLTMLTKFESCVQENCPTGNADAILPGLLSVFVFMSAAMLV